MFALGMVVLTVLWWQLPIKDWIAQFRLWILELGFPGVIAFAVVYVLITLILGPASALTLAAGFAYGLWGFPLVVLSASLGAALAFLIGRYVARNRVARWIDGNRRLRSLSRVIDEESWRVVGLMRLSPLIPYGMQNYLFSVTQIGFVPYLLATIIGIMPATALYVYIGSLGQGAGHATIYQWSLALFGLLATALIVWFVSKRASALLDDRIDINDE